MNDLSDLQCPLCGEGENLVLETVEEGAVVRTPFGSSAEEADEETLANAIRGQGWDMPLRCGECDHYGPIHSFEGRIAEWMRALKQVQEHHPKLFHGPKGGAA